MKGLQPENRPVTAKERSLIEWLLRHGKPGSEQFLQQVAEHILADYLATVKGEDVGVILFQRGGRLSSLEVYSQAGTDRPFGLPELETMYSYEELPERNRKYNRVES
jgi:hypothetical protein